MSDENYLKEVREHYENYPYPVTNPDDEFTRLYMPILEAFDRMNYYCYEGRMNFRKGFRALVAGGGTGDAVNALAEQLRDTDGEVVYIDMSEASMAIAQQRARNRGLTNITWIRDSLLNLEKLDVGTFDYINSSGVLHHLADPDEGLRILASLLKEYGAMGLMLYAPYGRTAVYQMQDLLRMVNKDEPDMHQRVANAKAILNHLPTTNWFPQSPPEMLGEVQTDIGIYDLLLHAQDRAYSIPQLYGFIEKQGLILQHLLPEHPKFGQRLYDALFYLKDPHLEAKMRALPLREQQAIAELLHGHIFKHTFYVVNSPRTLPAADDLDAIPYLSSDIAPQQETLCDSVRESGMVVYLHQRETDVRVAFAKGEHHEAMLRAIDGKRSLREVFRIVIDGYRGRKGAPNYQALLAEFLPMYDALNRYYWMFVRRPGSSYVLSEAAMQARVQKPA